MLDVPRLRRAGIRGRLRRKVSTCGVGKLILNREPTLAKQQKKESKKASDSSAAGKKKRRVCFIVKKKVC